MKESLDPKAVNEAVLSVKSLLIVKEEVKRPSDIGKEKTEYMFMSHHQDNGQNCNIKVPNKTSGNLAKLKYLRTAVPNQNDTQREIKSRPNSANT
jgi:hypothetical protein